MMAARTRPRLVDIAAKAGVSPPVVSTVLRGDGADLAASTSGNIRVAPETAERIRRIAREMNYRPNVTAQLLRGRKSDVIGVLIGVGSPALNFERLAAIEQAAYQRGYRLMVGQFRGDSDRIARYVQDFLDRHVEALICFHNPLPEHDDRVVELLEQIPGLVFQTQSLVEGACRVDVDRAAGATDAVKYLASKGRRRIGLVLGGRAPVFLTDRLQGYLRGIEAVGRAPEAALRWVGDADNVPPTPRRAEEAIDAVVGRGNADAIVASNDLWAIHLVKALRRRGLRVPDDVAVVGFDNIEAAALSDPALTTVDQDNAAFAEAAVDLALRSVHEPEQIKPEQRTVIVRPRLVVRESA